MHKACCWSYFINVGFGRCIGVCLRVNQVKRRRKFNREELKEETEEANKYYDKIQHKNKVSIPIKVHSFKVNHQLPRSQVWSVVRGVQKSTD